MTTLMIDTGQNIIGVYSVEDNEYVAYRTNTIAKAIDRIQNADEVVTYNGTFRDLEDLGRFAGIDGDLPIKGKHIDMQRMCWDPIIGSSLRRTYSFHCKDCPDFPFGRRNAEECDDYENSNQCDVYMTLKLWELWKERKLNLPGDGYCHH